MRTPRDDGDRGLAALAGLQGQLVPGAEALRCFPAAAILRRGFQVGEAERGVRQAVAERAWLVFRALALAVHAPALLVALVALVGIGRDLVPEIGFAVLLKTGKGFSRCPNVHE